MTGNCQVRFLEDGTRVILPCYSTNDEDEKHHKYITNIQKDVLNAKDIAKLYGTRWDIELLFKELKSRYALDVLETKNVQIIEALIWTAMLTLIVSRFMALRRSLWVRRFSLQDHVGFYEDIHTKQRRAEFILWSKTQQLILKKWLDIRSRVGVKYSQRRQQICCCLLYTSPSPRDGLLSR